MSGYSIYLVLMIVLAGATAFCVYALWWASEEIELEFAFAPVDWPSSSDSRRRRRQARAPGHRPVQFDASPLNRKSSRLSESSYAADLSGERNV